MDVISAIALFQNGGAKIGKYIVNTSFFDLPTESILNILKSGYHPFSHDLAILVSALMGAGSDKISKRISALRSFSSGHSLSIEEGLFDGINIACIRIARREAVFSNVGSPLVVLSTDGGNKWTGMIKSRCRTASIQTWVNIYYSGLLESIKFIPSAEFFLYDFRYVGVFKPKENKFLATTLFLADKRSIAAIKQACLSSYTLVPDLKDESFRLHKPPTSAPKNQEVSSKHTTTLEKDVVTKKTVHLQSPSKNISSPLNSPKRHLSDPRDAERSPKRLRKD